MQISPILLLYCLHFLSAKPSFNILCKILHSWKLTYSIVYSLIFKTFRNIKDNITITKFWLHFLTYLLNLFYSSTIWKAYWDFPPDMYCVFIFYLLNRLIQEMSFRKKSLFFFLNLKVVQGFIENQLFHHHPHHLGFSSSFLKISLLRGYLYICVCVAVHCKKFHNSIDWAICFNSICESHSIELLTKNFD